MIELSPRVVRWVWALCLVGGTTTHALTLWRHGLVWDYGGVPLFTRVYWTSLTFADPLAAVLLFVRPRLGIVLTLSIISTDVLHNTWFVWHSRQPFWSLANWALYSQIAFLAFSALTAPLLWRAARAPKPMLSSTSSREVHAFPSPPVRILKPGLIYFLTVFGAGFALAFIRLPFLVPHFGVRTAELIEMPVMLAVIVWASRRLARRNPQLGRAARLRSGLVALALLVAAELGVAYVLGARSPAEYVASRDPVSGSAYLLALMFFAVAPALWRGRKG